MDCGDDTVDDGAGVGDVDVDVVIVTYNNTSTIADCVRSIRRQVGVDTRLTLVDNSPDDATAEAITELLGPDLHLINNDTNTGFGAAVNQGARCGRAPWLLVFNPDAMFQSDTDLVSMLEHWRRVSVATGKSAGVLGPRLENVDGSTYPNGRHFPRMGVGIIHAFASLVLRSGSRRYLDGTQGTNPIVGDAYPLDWVSGCAMLLPRKLFESVSGFDEAYFMYVEDMDLCWRIHQCGGFVTLDKGVSVTHVGAVSSGGGTARTTAYHHQSIARFLWKTTTWPSRAILPVVTLGLIARWLAIVAKLKLTRH